MPAWRRTWWVVFFSNLITAVGMMSFLPFFPAILADMGVSDPDARATWSGVLFGAAPLAAAFMGPIWGSIGDRFGRKLMVVRALVAIAVFVGAMGFATNPWHLLALRLGQGVFSGFVPPSITLVSVITPHELQGRVTGTLQAAMPIGAIIGPLAGELIQAAYRIQAIFGFVSIAAGTGAVLVALFAREDPSLRITIERFSPTTLLVGTFRDVAALLGNRSLRLALLVFFTVQLGMGATNPLLLLYVEELWDGDPARVEALTAWLFSSFALAGVMATSVWGHLGDRLGHHRILVVTTLFTGACLAGHGLVTAYVGLLSMRVAAGLCAPGTNVAVFGFAATSTSGERRGGAFGVVFSARAFAVSIGAMSGGALSSLLSLRGLFLLAAGGIAVVLTLERLAVRRR